MSNMKEVLKLPNPSESLGQADGVAWGATGLI